jgi:hypothetical protein
MVKLETVEQHNAALTGSVKFFATKEFKLPTVAKRIDWEKLWKKYEQWRMENRQKHCPWSMWNEDKKKIQELIEEQLR